SDDRYIARYLGEQSERRLRGWGQWENYPLQRIVLEYDVERHVREPAAGVGSVADGGVRELRRNLDSSLYWQWLGDSHHSPTAPPWHDDGCSGDRRDRAPLDQRRH